MPPAAATATRVLTTVGKPSASRQDTSTWEPAEPGRGLGSVNASAHSLLGRILRIWRRCGAGRPVDVRVARAVQGGPDDHPIHIDRDRHPVCVVLP
jgi:hypothetical protein